MGNVGIHVRRSDFGDNFRVSYFEKALANLKLWESEALSCVVVTDDPGWVRSQPFFDGMALSEGQTPGKDMSILAACKHVVMSVGTFGWWGAYLKSVPGTVQYYIPRWIALHPEMYSVEQHYLPEWVGIPHDPDDPCYQRC